MLLTGALLFWLEPLKCYNSLSFRVKLLLLLLLVFAAFLPPKLARVSIAHSMGRGDPRIARNRLLLTRRR